MVLFIKVVLKFLTYYSLALIFVVLSAICIDSFYVFKDYEHYYAGNQVSLNRGVLSFNRFNKNKENNKYDSFIFGSSRSIAFKCSEWEKYLAAEHSSYHFDSLGEGIYGISIKIKYLDSIGQRIRNAIIIIDQDVLSITNNRDGHLFIAHPSISNESKLEYYYTFIKAQLNIKFIIAQIDYAGFKKYRPYMSNLFSNVSEPFIEDPITNDLWYGEDKMIRDDSTRYYDRLIQAGVFYDDRPQNDKHIYDIEDEWLLLSNIKDIFTSHHTQYKIIISPLYNQIALHEKQVKMLEAIFGAENIYNYSGDNEYTNNYGNYYEQSHFRTHVANQIFEDIYQTKIGEQEYPKVAPYVQF